MVITRAIVARKIIEYLQEFIDQDNLIEWANEAMLRSSINENNESMIIYTLEKLSVMNDHSSGYSIEVCQDLLKDLGYSFDHSQPDFIET